jgi:hypothetical protein
VRPQLISRVARISSPHGAESLTRRTANHHVHVFWRDAKEFHDLANLQLRNVGDQTAEWNVIVLKRTNGVFPIVDAPDRLESDPRESTDSAKQVENLWLVYHPCLLPARHCLALPIDVDYK